MEAATVNSDIPIACTLNDAEFRERERTVLDQLKASVIDVIETTNGFAFLFPSDDASFAALNEFIVLERRCCPFLDFNLTIPRGLGEIRLEVSGEVGVKDFIASNFLP